MTCDRHAPDVLARPRRRRCRPGGRRRAATLAGAQSRHLVISVAGGRAKRRKLAEALAGAAIGPDRRPFAGAPGRRGPADRAAQGRGHRSISPPACAGCGRGTCAPCSAAGRTGTAEPAARRAQRCAACGNTRPVTFRDRDGQPRCGKCPPGDGRQTRAELIAGSRCRDRPRAARRPWSARCWQSTAQSGQRYVRLGPGPARAARAARPARAPGRPSRRCCG